MTTHLLCAGWIGVAMQGAGRRWRRRIGCAWLRAAGVGFSAVITIACAQGAVRSTASPDTKPDYLRYVAFEAPGHEYILLRWPKARFPLKIYLPRPPEGLFEDPDAVYDATRSGIVDWTGAGGPDLPSFEFVDTASAADIPIAWAEQSPTFAVAHCFYAVNLFQRRLGVAQILVTGRYRDGSLATPDDLYLIVLHEMGHALGLGGHSPNPEDAMYGFLHLGDATAREATAIVPGILGRPPVGTARALSERDRATLRRLYEKPIGARMSGARRAY